MNYELLAPAGDLNTARVALRYGADAVYMGGTKFGARAFADNPDTEYLLRAIDYVHLHGKRLYLTVNTLLKQKLPIIGKTTKKTAILSTSYNK